MLPEVRRDIKDAQDVDTPKGMGKSKLTQLLELEDDPIEIVYLKNQMKVMVQLDEAEKRKTELYIKNKIVGSDYEAEVVRLLAVGMKPGTVQRSLSERFGLKLDFQLVKAYRDRCYEHRRAKFEKKWDSLVPDAETTLEYLEGLVRIREGIVKSLEDAMTVIAVGRTFQIQNLIHIHLTAIEQSKAKIMELTGGLDDMKRKQQIISQVSTIAVKCFLPAIPEMQRDVVVKVFRTDIMKFTEEVT